MSTTQTIYFITLTPPDTPPFIVEVHKSFDGAADAVNGVKEQLKDTLKLDEAFDRINAKAPEVLVRSRDEYKEVFDSAKIVPCEASFNGVAKLLTNYGMDDRNILDNIIMPAFMKFVDEAPESGYMQMSDVYKVFSYFSLMTQADTLNDSSIN